MIGAVAVLGVLASPGLRVPMGVPLSAAGLVAAYVAPLHGRFEGIDAVLFFGSLLTLLLAISAFGFRDGDDRRRTWGDPLPLLAVETGRVAAWSYPRSRGRRFLGEIGTFAVVGPIGFAVALHVGSGWRAGSAVVGTVLVVISAFLRAPVWPVVCVAGVTAALIAAWGATSWASLAWVAFQAGIAFVYLRDVAWKHRSTVPASEPSAR